CRSGGHDRAGPGAGAVDRSAGQDLVAEAMEQGKSRIRQGQGEVGILSTGEQGEEAEGPSKLVVSVRLHEGLRIGLGETDDAVLEAPKDLGRNLIAPLSKASGVGVSPDATNF